MCLSQFWKRAPGTVGICRMPNRNLLPWFFVAGHSRVLVTELEKSSETKLFFKFCMCVCVCICQLHLESVCEQFDLRNLYVSWEDFVVTDIVIFFNLHRIDCDCWGWKPAWPSHLCPFKTRVVLKELPLSKFMFDARVCTRVCVDGTWRCDLKTGLHIWDDFWYARPWLYWGVPVWLTGC